MFRSISLLYTPNLKYSEGDVRKNQEFMDSSGHYNRQNHQLHNSRLTRYRSAPSSFLESLINEFGVKAMKQEEPEPITEQNSSHLMYQNLPVHSLANDNSYSDVCSIALENSMQERMATGNGSNLITQNSSPAGFFSNLGVDTGFAGMRDGECFRACNGSNGEATTTDSRLINRFNFSPRSSSRFMPQISEIGNQSIGNSSPEKSFLSNNGSSRQYMSKFPSDSWDNNSFSGVKKARDDDCNMSFGLNEYETQNGNSGNQSTRFVHHLSFPKTSAEMAAVEKFLHFQGSVPCKIRAKRGCATHPRSIAERVRRIRISERMRKLQDLFPNMDKTNTADMLDLAVEYIKDLQKQVKTLKDNKAKCRC